MGSSSLILSGRRSFAAPWWLLGCLGEGNITVLTHGNCGVVVVVVVFLANIV